LLLTLNAYQVTVPASTAASARPPSRKAANSSPLPGLASRRASNPNLTLIGHSFVGAQFNARSDVGFQTVAALKPLIRSHLACGSFAGRRLLRGAEGGGTTGPISPSGASSRPTITGAWSLCPV